MRDDPDPDDDYAPDEGTDPDEPLDDCMDCGTCRWCVERSIAAADEYGDDGYEDDPEHGGED